MANDIDRLERRVEQLMECVRLLAGGSDDDIDCTVADGGSVPVRARDGDAGLDLVALGDADIPGVMQNDVGLPAICRRVVPTGLAFAIPHGYVGMVLPRSGLASRGIVAVTGVIDSSYRGNVGVTLENRSGSTFAVRKGDRIAQLVVMPCWTGALQVVAALDSTERGVQGFGSTGV